MTHHVDARYDEDDGIFLPPQRTLGFNPQLTINDSLLALSYVEAYDISYPEALQRIEDEVNELKMRLQSEGSYDLNDIGTLSLNEDGHYVFAPCEAGILTPGLYGLGSFDMKRVAAVTKPEPAKIVPMDPEAPEIPMDEEEEDDVVKIKFSWIRNTVAVAAVLLAIFLLALPTGKTEMMTRTISNLNNTILFGMMSKDTNTSKIEIKKEDIAKHTAKVDTTLKRDTVKTEPVVQKDSVKKGYCIVLASYVSKQNAQMYIEMLKKKGLDSAEIYMHNDVRRVVCGNFQTPNEAYIALRDIHQAKGLEEAWVYKYQ